MACELACKTCSWKDLQVSDLTRRVVCIDLTWVCRVRSVTWELTCDLWTLTWHVTCKPVHDMWTKLWYFLREDCDPWPLLRFCGDLWLTCLNTAVWPVTRKPTCKSWTDLYCLESPFLWPVNRPVIIRLYYRARPVNCGQTLWTIVWPIDGPVTCWLLYGPWTNLVTVLLTTLWSCDCPADCSRTWWL